MSEDVRAQGAVSPTPTHPPTHPPTTSTSRRLTLDRNHQVDETIHIKSHLKVMAEFSLCMI